jgi:predicted flap endonuclease-1-like 5' DNA nuclease
MRRLVEIRDGRIAELEHALEAARARADDAASRVAVLERTGPASASENEELSHLRTLVARHETERAREIEVAGDVTEDDAIVLQAWRLRYFEQRVRYLEGVARPEPVAVALAEPPVAEWRVREAEARAAHLEQEVRTLSAPSPEPTESPFAANAEVDVLLRWRLLYLERRVAYLQDKAAQAAVDPAAERWKWRARYLEARVRHLEPRHVAQALPETAPDAKAESRAESSPATRREKPHVLPAARNGAPDDFTLIEEVSVLQQTTLYSIGVFHFDQIAAWTPANVAWVDQYLRLRGRIIDEEWVEQARDLSRGGVDAARRMLAEEDA